MSISNILQGAGSQATENAFSATQGINYSGSVWGSTIPLSMGFRKINGTIIWAGKVFKNYEKSETVPAPPGFTGATTYTKWTLTRKFAISLGKRLNPSDDPPQVRRIWADGTLVMANGTGVPLNYAGLQQDYLPSGRWVNGVWVPFNNGEPDSSMSSSLAVFGFAQPLNPLLSNLTFRFYTGTDTQLPDQALVDELGPLATAFRGQMYMVVEGLIIGKGFSQKTVGGSGIGINGDMEDQGVINTFPQIAVELMDGNATSVGDHNFHMLDNAVPFNFPSEVVQANWNTRELAIFSPVPGGVSHLNLFDMNSASQTACLPITGAGTDGIGTTAGFSAWDYINDIFYTERSGDHCLCSVNKAGVVVSTAMTVGPGLVPRNVDSTTITDAKPAIEFPRPTYSDVDYILAAGALWPCILAGTTWTAAYTPSDAGVINPSLPPSSFYLPPTGNVQSVMGLDLYKPALQSSHLSYQDAAFIVASAAEVQIVYVSARAIGSLRVSVILGRQTIYTAVYGSSAIHALVDADGNVMVQEFLVGSDTLYTKIKIDTSSSPDFTVAPGWRGLFPKAGVNLLLDHVHSTVGGVWEGNTLVNSDTTNGTISVLGAAIMNLADASIQTISALSGFDGTTSAWDSVNTLRFFHGNIAASGQQPFSGHGMHFAQVFTGLTGTVNTVGQVVRDIAHVAGYVDADLTIDVGLTDQVPGVLILGPYDLTTLYNDIGAMYDFAYFNSANKLKFSRSSNDPVKAIGGWTVSGFTSGLHTVTIQDGDTATIGTFVYRFKTVPVAPFDVKISGDDVDSAGLITLNAKEKTAANFLAAISGNLALASADSQNPALNPGFFAGTVKNNLVTAKATTASATNFGFVSLAIIAQVGGVTGNSIATTSTGSHHAFDHTTLINGAAPPTASIQLAHKDLALEQVLTQNDGLITTIAPPGLAQQAATVDYYGLEQDYAPMAQTYIPDNQNGLVVNSTNTVTYKLPFVMSTSEAYARVAKTAIRLADNVIVQTFRLTQAFLLLEPSDIIGITIAPFNYTVRLDECTFNGDYSTSYAAINYTFRSDVAINDSDATGTLPQTVATGSDCLPVVLDTPLRLPKQGTIPGNIDLFEGVRAYRTGFGLGSLTAAKVVAGVAGTGAELLTTSHDVKWGTIVGVMPAAVEPFYRTVEDTLTINCKTINIDTDLASASYLNFVSGANCLAIGQPGNWEFVFFRDVVKLNSKTVKLTGLVRAQRGTDAAVTHSISDVVLLVASTAAGFVDPLLPQAVASSQVGTIYRYTASGLPSTAGAATQDNTLQGLELYPFSPCRLKAVLAGGNDLNLTWVRRDRLATQFVTTPPVMSETTELYDLEILSGSTVVRTVLGLATPAYTYTSAQQVTDGFTPPLATLKFRVYQKGELGRGFPRLETINVS